MLEKRILKRMYRGIVKKKIEPLEVIKKEYNSLKDDEIGVLGLTHYFIKYVEQEK